LFTIDIFIIFNTAYYDLDFKIIDSRKEISKSYITGWFTVDTLAVIPFDYILISSNEFKHLIRFARIGRLYKLIKLTRLFKIFKIVKNKSNFLKFFTEVLKLGLGFNRLFFFIMISFILSHIVTCLWIMLP